MGGWNSEGGKGKGNTGVKVRKCEKSMEPKIKSFFFKSWPYHKNTDLIIMVMVVKGKKY